MAAADILTNTKSISIKIELGQWSTELLNQSIKKCPKTIQYIEVLIKIPLKSLFTMHK